MAAEYLEDYCGSPFWNTTSAWHTNDPELTECFEKTVLVWVPCIFLWLFWVMDAVYMRYSYTRNVPWNWRNISKFVLTGALILLTFIDVIGTVTGKTIVYNADIYSPLIKIISFILSLILVYYNKKYGLHTSGVLFVFWFLMTVCGVPQFRKEILRSQRDQVPEELYTSHIIYLIQYPVVVLMFILNIIADKPAEESKYAKSEKQCPEETASFISRVTFSWLDILIWRGFKKPLEAKNLWDMSPEDTTKELVPRFEKNWLKSLEKVQNYNRLHHLDGHSKSKGDYPTQRVKKQASILPAIIKTFGPAYLFAISLKVVQDIMMFINPQILGLIISFVREGGEQWKGIMYAFLLFGNAIIQTSFQSSYLKKAFTMGMRVRSVVISVVYKKALTISNTARRERTVGEIVNLMAVDAQKFNDLANHINQIWSAPLQISLAIFFLWQEMGPAVLSGLAIMIILIPINAIIASKNKRLHVTQMKFKDERVKQMNEILNGIKVLKLYAWEPSFERQVLKVRDKEIRVLKHSAYLHAGTSFILTCAPFLVSLVTFATYVLIDENNVLDANKAYVSISLFNIMRQPLNMLPNLISNLIQTVVSVKRLNKFMNSEDLDANAVFHEPNKEYPLTIENGTFSWGDTVTLRDINVQLKVNTLTAVVGSVGAGKSSLVSAFLGEMEKISGKVNTFGSIAYVSQLAYIQNATLKENILFGKPYDKELYDKVIHACALKPDLDMLPGADLTEIGEKGINLSGGQKQRVSLARAVYANADIYFMDDPLSAVDSHVGKHIFEQVIGPKGLLKNKTKLLVTHGITYLSQTDHIIVIKDGEISESGTYQQLLSQKRAFAEFLLQHLNEDSADDNELDELQDQLADTSISEEVTRRLDRQRSRTSETELKNVSIKRASVESIKDRTIEKGLKEFKTKAKRGQKLTEKEKAETGNVSLAVYRYYLKSIGYMFMLIIVGLTLVYQGFQVSSNVWLGMWADDDKMVVNGTVDVGRRDMYLGVYGALGIGQVTTLVIANVLFTKITLDAAVRIHRFLLNNILRLPMAFFDTTPMGRILARFSNDINGVDERLPSNMQMIIMRLVQVIGSLSVICYTVPWFAVLLIPISIIYVFMQRLYVATSRQLKRLESVSRSPIYSHFGETVSGVQVIRAFNQQQRFIMQSESKVDLNQVCHYPSINANRWISIRLEMMGNCIILFASMFSVLGRNMAPGIVGLTISYALQITQLLNFIVRQSSDLETNIVAVERIKEYGETAQEASWEIPNKTPSKAWPEVGAVEFKNFAVRYRASLDLVLTGVNFHINGGEKVGIVGRTGAGKSSMTLSLFRIIEAAQGQILIDGVNVAEIGLHSLRSRLTIIPQDAVLFSGTLRMNLDPFEEHSDQEIWTTLEHAHLKPFVKGLTAGLQHEIAEGGENLSAGQRQLVCLARALLRKTKILILDEATAAVDLETDDLIQKTIRTEFKECTVITIAHRLNTIMDSDRIMLLDKGKIVEFDSPANLLANPDSLFSGMHKDAGLS